VRISNCSLQANPTFLAIGLRIEAAVGGFRLSSTRTSGPSLHTCDRITSTLHRQGIGASKSAGEGSQKGPLLASMSASK
jgi:hypothetical protein